MFIWRVGKQAYSRECTWMWGTSISGSGLAAEPGLVEGGLRAISWQGSMPLTAPILPKCQGNLNLCCHCQMDLGLPLGLASVFPFLFSWYM